jgi:hypothetical protein
MLCRDVIVWGPLGFVMRGMRVLVYIAIILDIDVV